MIIKIFVLAFLLTILLETNYVKGAPKEGAIKNKPEENVCLTPGCIHAASAVLKMIDETVDPCDDFYKFACGRFIKSTQIPPEKNVVSIDTQIMEELQDKIKALLAERTSKPELRPFWLLKHYYRICINKRGIENRGLRTIKFLLKDIGGWPVLEGDAWKDDKFDWKDVIYDLSKLGYDAHYLLGVTVGVDDKNSSRYAIVINTPTLGINQKHLSSEYDEEIVTAYHNFMVEVAKIFGGNTTQATEELQKSLEFEISLANISSPIKNKSDTTNLYNPMSVKDLQLKYPSIQWKTYISTLLNHKINDTTFVIVRNPEYLRKLEKLLETTPKRVIFNYISWRVVKDSIPFLTQALSNQMLKFDEKYKGRKEKEHRSKECTNIVREGLNLGIGALYARRHFNRNSKNDVMEIIVNIRKAFADLLEENDWMDIETKKNAIEKVNSMTTYVGYTDEIYDNKKLDDYYELYLNTSDFLIASLVVNAFNKYKITQMLDLPINKTDWKTRPSAAIFNAFYLPAENSIHFPAGLLQGAYFDSNRPNFMNYGAIGYVIGQQIVQGFDNLGRNYDKNGNLNDWWSKDTASSFIRKTQCLVNQYKNKSLSTLKLKSNEDVHSHVGNTIINTGGVTLAYKAYHDMLSKHKPESQLPGIKLSSKQLFWVSMANTLCAKSQPDYVKSINERQLQANMAFGNNEYFINDFKCPSNSKMNPLHKCQIW